MTADRLDVAAARAICDAATSGPWSIEWDSHDAECQINPPFPYAIRMTAAPKYGAQEWADQYRGGELRNDDYNRTEVSDLSDADLIFIAAAREGWPAALDEITALRAAIDRVTALHAEDRHPLTGEVDYPCATVRAATVSRAAEKPE